MAHFVTFPSDIYYDYKINLDNIIRIRKQDMSDGSFEIIITILDRIITQRYKYKSGRDKDYEKMTQEIDSYMNNKNVIIFSIKALKKLK
jgi:predicted glycoside hydrolase/deacetylase ChbG (UPF0249 family)